MKKFIFNADDNGRSHGIINGTLETHLHGKLTSTTVMMNMPFALEAIQTSQYTHGREREIELLTAATLPGLLASAGVSLCAFRSAW